MPTMNDTLRPHKTIRSASFGLIIMNMQVAIYTRDLTVKQSKLCESQGTRYSVIQNTRKTLDQSNRKTLSLVRSLPPRLVSLNSETCTACEMEDQLSLIKYSNLALWLGSVSSLKYSSVLEHQPRYWPSFPPSSLLHKSAWLRLRSWWYILRNTHGGIGHFLVNKPFTPLSMGLANFPENCPFCLSA